MKKQLDLYIYYNNISKKWEVFYNNDKTEYETINDLLTFLGKRCLNLQHEAEFVFKTPNEELQRLFS